MACRHVPVAVFVTRECGIPISCGRSDRCFFIAVFNITKLGEAIDRSAMRAAIYQPAPVEWVICDKKPICLALPSALFAAHPVNFIHAILARYSQGLPWVNEDSLCVWIRRDQIDRSTQVQYLGGRSWQRADSAVLHPILSTTGIDVVLGSYDLNQIAHAALPIFHAAYTVLELLTMLVSCITPSITANTCLATLTMYVPLW